MAILAIYIWFNRASIAYVDIRHAFTQGDHFHTQLMARNTRIAKKGHFAQISGKVCAADTHLMNTYYCHTGCWCGWLGDFNASPVKR
jgi:hypothetical protein